MSIPLTLAEHISKLDAIDVSAPVPLNNEAVDAVLNGIALSVQKSVQFVFETYLVVCYLLDWCSRHLSPGVNIRIISLRLLSAHSDSVEL
jgi:hypothetical protein